MRKAHWFISLSTLLVVYSFLFFAPAAASPADPLWRKAVKIAGASEEAGVYPSHVRVFTRVYKSRNRLDSTNEVIYNVHRDSSGENHLELVKMTEDGKDRTAEARAEEKKAERKRKAKNIKGKKDDQSVSISLNFHPFSPEAQRKVEAHRLREEELEGRKAILFSFTFRQKNAREMIRGKAWLEAVTGVPLKVVSSPDPLPKHVKSMKTTVIFRVDDKGRWIAEHSLIEARGSFLFISRDVVTRVTFSKYREKPLKSPPSDNPKNSGEKSEEPG